MDSCKKDILDFPILPEDIPFRPSYFRDLYKDCLLACVRIQEYYTDLHDKRCRFAVASNR
jgi:hypothetical protein